MKNLFARSFWIFLVFSVPLFCYSQSDFREGFVVKKSGDSLYGLVNYREGSGAFRVCEFRESFDHDVITYRPGEIQKYGFVRDKVFESREITLQEEPPRRVFLEILVDGLASLYKFDDTFWVEKDGGGLQQLRNDPRVIESEGKKVLGRTNKHISTLAILLHDCPQIIPEIQNIRSIRERPLTNVIEEYNICMEVPYIVYKDQKPWFRSAIGITFGYGASRMEFLEHRSHYSYKYLLGATEISKLPAIGVSLGIFFPRINERISFHADIFYLNSSYFRYSIIEEIYSTTINYVTLETKKLKIPYGLRYTFPPRNFTPYFSIGFSNTLNIASDSKWIQEIERTHMVERKQDENIRIKDSQFGLWGSAGIQKSVTSRLNSFLEFRFEQTRGIVRYKENQPMYNLSIINLQLFTGITF